MVFIKKEKSFSVAKLLLVQIMEFSQRRYDVDSTSIKHNVAGGFQH